MAFPLAFKNPLADINGLDIVEKTLEKNSIKAKEENLGNLHFVSYNGEKFPFGDNEHFA